MILLTLVLGTNAEVSRSPIQYSAECLKPHFWLNLLMTLKMHHFYSGHNKAKSIDKLFKKKKAEMLTLGTKNQWAFNSSFT